MTPYCFRVLTLKVLALRSHFVFCMQGWYFQTCQLFVLCPVCGCIYLKRPFSDMIASIYLLAKIYIFAIWEGVTFWLWLGWKTPFWQLSEPCDIYLLMFLAHILLVTVKSSMLSRVLINYFVQCRSVVIVLCFIFRPCWILLEKR